MRESKRESGTRQQRGRPWQTKTFRKGRQAERQAGSKSHKTTTAAKHVKVGQRENHGKTRRESQGDGCTVVAPLKRCNVPRD